MLAELGLDRAVPVVLLLGGAEHEGALDREQMTSLEEGVADLSVTTVAGAGHFLMAERPDVVTAAVLELSAAAASGAPSPR